MRTNVDQLLDIPPHKSVLIFSQFRSGSTALADHISKKLDVTNFDEAFHNCYPQRNRDFLDHLPKRCVFKVTGDQAGQAPAHVLDRLWNDCYVIKLSRQNLLDQCTSWVISERGNTVWHQKRGQQVNDYTVNIERNWFQLHINQIIRTNRMHNEFHHPKGFDLELEYEKITIPKSDYQPRKRPDNYTQVRNSVAEILNNHFGISV